METLIVAAEGKVTIPSEVLYIWSISRTVAPKWRLSSVKPGVPQSGNAWSQATNASRSKGLANIRLIPACLRAAGCIAMGVPVMSAMGI
jgi:hypothetical protein